jgi:hypothetical protein
MKCESPGAARIRLGQRFPGAPDHDPCLASLRLAPMSGVVIVASSSTCPVLVACDLSAPFVGIFLRGHAPGEKFCRRGSVSRGLLEIGHNVARGIVVGEAMGPEEDREGAVRIFVNTNGRLDEVRP